jgi:hypothetical protein
MIKGLEVWVDVDIYSLKPVGLKKVSRLMNKYMKNQFNITATRT